MKEDLKAKDDDDVVDEERGQQDNAHKEVDDVIELGKSEYL